jgi:predicted nucleic acid-binding protein
VALIVDAAPVVALADENEPASFEIERILHAEPGPLVIPAPVTAEVDYLLATRLGRRAQRAFLADLAAGRFVVECLDARDYGLAAEVDDRYSDLRLGLADLSVILMAARFGSRRLLTFDEHDFRSVTPIQGGSFELLPADVETARR